MNRYLLLIGAALIIALTAVYSNHFDNTFHFDDSHAVVNNIYIRSLKNIPKFFTDATTLTSLPQNQSYRPMMPLSYAIDYRLAGNKLDPFYFHLSMFIWYVLLCILLYFLYLHIFNNALQHKYNAWFALFASAFFAFHTVNAETINYISSRSDSMSTFWLVLGLIVYIYFPAKRQFYFYLLPVVIGILFKPSALVFAPLLMIYIWLFENGKGISDIFSWKNLTKKNFLIAAIPSLILCFSLYYFQAKMTPSTFIPGNKLFNYLITQPYVVWEYFKAFFLPLHLSADTDLRAFDNMKDPRFMGGMLFLMLLLVSAVYTSHKKEWRPVAFGIAWYILALLPSSSIIPLAEVMNDHRMFFPNIGLTISVVWTFAMLCYKNEKKTLQSSVFRKGIVVFMFLIISAHAYGTRQRNEVWHDGESLWYDVTIKSPKNGRGLMNYGLRKMELGDYATAEKYYMEALKYNPYYSYLHTNIAILKSAQGKTSEAEDYFKKSIQFAPGNPETYYFYGNFLNKQKRFSEAKENLRKAVSLAPAHLSSRQSLMETYYETGENKALENLCNETLSIFPDDALSMQYFQIAKTGKSKLQVMEEEARQHPTPQKWLNLSLSFYRAGNYEKCVEACNEALKLKPDYAEAFNNICSAYNMLGRYDEAETACKKALQINPEFELAKGNLKAINDRKNKVTAALAIAKQNPTSDNYINLSLVYYNEGMFIECINACNEALKINPQNFAAYNNICSAYNQLKEWEKAIKACEKALEIKSDFTLARNNLNYAKNQLR